MGELPGQRFLGPEGLSGGRCGREPCRAVAPGPGWPAGSWQLRSASGERSDMELGPGEEPGQDPRGMSPAYFSWPWIWLARMPGEYVAVRGGFPECSSDGSIKVRSPRFGVAGAAVWWEAAGGGPTEEPGGRAGGRYFAGPRLGGVSVARGQPGAGARCGRLRAVHFDPVLGVGGDAGIRLPPGRCRGRRAG